MKPARKIRPRFLPVVMTGVAGLFFLKVVGLATHGGYTLAAPGARFSTSRAVKALETDVSKDVASDADVTGSAPPKKEPKEDAKKPAAEEKKPEPVQPLPPALPSGAERQLLEKLGERRNQLDERLKEIELREQMLKSAEKMLQEKLGELREAETRVSGTSQAKDQGEQSQMRGLVIMYEGMKPREAARVFERMDGKLLAMLAQQMNPRKLSEVLAQMTPDAAEKLTSNLMRKAPPAEPAKAPPVPAAPKPAALEELPRLEREKSPKG